MTKEDFIEAWHTINGHPEVIKTFLSSAYGRRGDIADGWRNVRLEKDGLFIEITMEKHPNLYLIYDDIHRFSLTPEEGENLIKKWIDAPLRLPIQKLLDLL
jgi:hypothetical protein